MLFRSNTLRVIEGDVVPVGKVASDSLWHGVDAYYGVLSRCQRCQVEFPFSAQEQKTWREVYGFSIHSHPIHCKPCRARERQFTLLRKRLSVVLSKQNFEQADFDELIAVAQAYIEIGEMNRIGYRLKQKVFWAGKRSHHPRALETVQVLKGQ